MNLKINEEKIRQRLQELLDSYRPDVHDIVPFIKEIIKEIMIDPKIKKEITKQIKELSSSKKFMEEIRIKVQREIIDREVKRQVQEFQNDEY